MKVDQRLERQTHFIKELRYSQLRLHENAALFWFILVPKTDKIEWVDLELSLQKGLLEEINLVSRYIQASHNVDKLNIAMLGNIVEQLHIHIIGRQYEDPYWPDPVWGKGYDNVWQKDKLLEIQKDFEHFLHAWRERS